MQFRMIGLDSARNFNFEYKSIYFLLNERNFYYTARDEINKNNKYVLNLSTLQFDFFTNF